MRFELLLLLFCLAPAIVSANPLTRALEASEPCQNLPQIDKTGHARVETASLHIDGNSVVVAAQGNIRCETSSAALFRSSASADFDIEARGDFATCTFPEVAVSISTRDGAVGRIIEPILVNAVREALTDACRDLP